MNAVDISRNFFIVWLASSELKYILTLVLVYTKDTFLRPFHYISEKDVVPQQNTRKPIVEQLLSALAFYTKSKMVSKYNHFCTAKNLCLSLSWGLWNTFETSGNPDNSVKLLLHLQFNKMTTQTFWYDMLLATHLMPSSARILKPGWSTGLW